MKRATVTAALPLLLILPLFGCSVGDPGDAAMTLPEAEVTQLASVGGFTCEQQKAWGKCGESWMTPVCDYVCLPQTCGSYPFCSSAAVDPDGDGWGWENNASCIVRGSAAASSQCPGSGGGGSCPSSVTCPGGMPCGCYTVSGLGASKQAFLAVGASVDFLASAMMETEKMDALSYAYGDNKTLDAFNAGACKQNWMMMRTAHPAWRSLGAGDYNTGDQLNHQRSLDVQVYNESRSYYGTSWWAGHRNGTSGLNNPNTQDINNFKSAWQWTKDRIGASHLSDDVRFWVAVPAI